MRRRSSCQAEDPFFLERPLSTIPLLQENIFPLKTTLSQRCFESGACGETLVNFPLHFKMLSFPLAHQNCLLHCSAGGCHQDRRDV